MAGRNGFGKLYQSEVEHMLHVLAGKPSAVAVYIALATMRNSVSLETCPVGDKLLAKITGLSISSVKRGRKQLEASGLVTRAAGGVGYGVRSIYHFNLKT